METLVIKTARAKSTVKWISLLAFTLLQAGSSMSQKAYDDFEGNKMVSYKPVRAVQLDTNAINPFRDRVNNSPTCAKFVRSHLRYDYIKLVPQEKLTSVSDYAKYDGNAPRLKMKVFTTAPIGSMVEIQLGKQEGNAYPEGIQSQFQAYTTVKGAWEVLEFKFAVTPKGSETSPNSVDQVTILFSPNSNSTDTWYFDDLTGPNLLAVTTTAKGRHLKK